MRVKKRYRILTFHTTTEAMTMEKRCEENGIPGRLIPVPGEITAGCGLAWRMTVEEYPLYEKKIKELRLKFEACVELMLY